MVSPASGVHAGCPMSASAAVERGRGRRGAPPNGDERAEQEHTCDDRPARAAHSDRPSTHSPTGSGWKPVRSVEGVRAVVVGLGVDECPQRAAVAQPVQAVDDERATEAAAVRLGVDCEPLHVAVGGGPAEQPVSERRARPW